MNLKEEILGGESYSLEFKLVPNEDRIKYLKTVVGFANGKGGRILFGVANDGTVRGIARGQTAEREVAGYSKIRNEVLAKALNYMRFIEEWGSGLKRVNDVLGDYGIRNVSIEDAGFAVRINVCRASATGDNKDAGALNGALNQGAGALNGALKHDVGELEEKVLTVIAGMPGINRKGIIEQVGVAPRSLDRLIAAMIENGKIQRLGGKKTGGYHCME